MLQFLDESTAVLGVVASVYVYNQGVNYAELVSYNKGLSE